MPGPDFFSGVPSPSVRCPSVLGENSLGGGGVRGLCGECVPEAALPLGSLSGRAGGRAWWVPLGGTVQAVIPGVRGGS